jgi:hypothetical protein
LTVIRLKMNYAQLFDMSQRDSLKTGSRNWFSDAVHRLAIRCAVSAALILAVNTLIQGPVHVVSEIMSNSSELIFASVVMVLAQIVGLAFYRAIRCRSVSVRRLTNFGLACETAVFAGAWILSVSGVVFMLYLAGINLFAMYAWWDDAILIVGFFPTSIVVTHKLGQRMPMYPHTYNNTASTFIQTGG